MVALLLYTGLRVSEAVSLGVADVVIRERSRHVIVRQGKGGKYREVPLSATVSRILTEYMTGITGDWFFSGKGGSMTMRAAEKTLAKFSRLSRVEVTPHRLRHTFCKMLADAGEGLDRIAMTCGILVIVFHDTDIGVI